MQQQLFNAAHASKWAAAWIERNQALESDLKEKSSQMLLDLDHSALALTSAANNVANRPTIGVFGPSQAGKSYLISKMAAGNESSLTTTWDDSKIDFIQHANPSGNDSEATGFATRFTHKSAQAPEGYPVELKIFNEIDLAMILVNSFFEEIEQDEVVFTQDEQVFLNHLKSLQAYVDLNAKAQASLFNKDSLSTLGDNTPTNALDFASTINYESTKGREIKIGNKVEYNYIQAEHVTALADYISRNSKGKIGSFAAMPNFWSELRNTLPYMNLEGRIKALSIFWKDLLVFNELYRDLANKLLALKGYSKLFASKSAFVELVDDQLQQRENGTIMHITKLKEIFNKQEKIPCALVSNKLDFKGVYAVDEVVEVGIADLAALSLELCYVLENHGSLDDFDVLDLPGARTRKEQPFNDVVNMTIYDTVSTASDGNDGAEVSDATDFFRRGKVAYLFDRYSNNNELDQLVFCVGLGKQQEVDAAFNILGSWVKQNIGPDAKTRAQVYSPLTVVLTRYDEVFNRGCRDLSGKKPFNKSSEINIAFERLFKFSWFKEWTPGKPFNHIFLARRPNLGDSFVPWMEFDEHGNELGIKSDKAEYINNSKKSLLEIEVFNRHIANYEQALEDVLKLNDGGVSKVVEALRAKALSNDKRLSLQMNKSSMLIQGVISELSPFATRDSAIALKKAETESKQLAYGLLQCNALSPCFNLLRSLLELPEDSLVDIYSQNFTTGSNAQRFVQFVCMEYQDNLANLWRKDNAYLSNIADNIVLSYRRQLPAFEAEPSIRKYFPLCFNEVENRFKTLEELKSDIVSLFNKLYVEIGKAFNSSVINLKSYMVQVLLDQENTSEGFKDSVKSQVQLLSFILSDFNLYLGANLLPSSEDKKAFELIKNNQNSSQTESSTISSNTINSIPDQYEDDWDEFDDDNDYDLAGSSNKSEKTSKSIVLPVGNISPSEFAMQVAQKGGVLGNELEGPANCFVKNDNYVSMDSSKSDHNVFMRQYSTDDTELLPHLDENSRNYEFNLVSDYASTLMYMMCKVNVLSENRYQFSTDENLLLCRILCTMESI